jgi:hypothetical protein
MPAQRPFHFLYWSPIGGQAKASEALDGGPREGFHPIVCWVICVMRHRPDRISCGEQTSSAYSCKMLGKARPGRAVPCSSPYLFYRTQSAMKYYPEYPEAFPFKPLGALGP